MGPEEDVPQEHGRDKQGGGIPVKVGLRDQVLTDETPGYELHRRPENNFQQSWPGTAQKIDVAQHQGGYAGEGHG